jgi:hypothetical protein
MFLSSAEVTFTRPARRTLRPTEILQLREHDDRHARLSQLIAPVSLVPSQLL